MSTSSESVEEKQDRMVVQLDSATIRFAGDSGDGMQLAGTQFTQTSALQGNDIATFPDFPAEIRAPRGTLHGVSGFQVHFSATEIFTPGDELDALVAMNPAALKTNLMDLEPGGILIVDEDSFDKKGLELAHYKSNPLSDGSLSKYQLFKVPLTTLTRRSIEGSGLGRKDGDKCRNFFAMGLVFWLYGRSLEPTERYIQTKFAGKPAVIDANMSALHAGYNYGDITEAFVSSYRVDKAKLAPGKYRNVMGNDALAWGLVTAAALSGKELFLGSYPITPASDILHELSKLKEFGVRTFQAEDEIAAITSCIGAAFGGAMAITTSSGPGIALKGEALGLGCMLELPMLVINIQRGGPSTGLPTKTEQSDLGQAIFGRNGEAPLPVIAPRSPPDCFEVAIEAWRIAVRYMVPVMLLSDGYIANGSEPWSIVDFASLPKIPVVHPTGELNGEPFLPYARDERLARPWAIPGTPNLMHRIGGLEKENLTGNVSYDPANHQEMVLLRQKKIDNIALDFPPQEVVGPDRGDVLVVSWGGTYGACYTAIRQAQADGMKVAHTHLRYLNPLPRDLGDILKRYRKVLIPELNMGQLSTILRARYLVDAIGFNKVQGRPFAVTELYKKIKEVVAM